VKTLFLIKAILSFITGFLSLEFIYWLAGNELFVRAPNTAFAFTMSVLIGFLVVWVSCGTDIIEGTYKNKRRIK